MSCADVARLEAEKAKLETDKAKLEEMVALLKNELENENAFHTSWQDMVEEKAALDKKVVTLLEDLRLSRIQCSELSTKHRASEEHLNVLNAYDVPRLLVAALCRNPKVLVDHPVSLVTQWSTMTLEQLEEWSEIEAGSYPTTPVIPERKVVDVHVVSALRRKGLSFSQLERAVSLAHQSLSQENVDRRNDVAHPINNIQKLVERELDAISYASSDTAAADRAALVYTLLMCLEIAPLKDYARKLRTYGYPSKHNLKMVNITSETSADELFRLSQKLRDAFMARGMAKPNCWQL